MTTSTHPCREELFAFLVGTLPEEAADTLADHVESCTVCQTTLAALDESEDELVAMLRRQEDAGPYAREPQCQAAIERVRIVEGAAVTMDGGGDAPVLNPATLLQLGEYEVLEKLGQGGMGAVYKARHTRLKRIVALKVLPPEKIDDPRAIARFEREMEAVGQLLHPNIVQAHDARKIDGTYLLVMEYVEGMDLAEVSRRLGPLPVADACELVRQAALGLQYAHEHGLVHRDIKPSNLMLHPSNQTSGGSAASVKILDLGLALLSEERRDAVVEGELTTAGDPMGTADYIAPEQVGDAHSVDIRADLYSLGCTLFKLLSGHAPFADSPGEGAFHKMMAHVNRPAPSIRQRRPDVPEELAAVLQRLLAKQPEERFATPAEVAAALTPFTAGCDLPGLLRRATGTTSAESPDAIGGTDKYRSSSFVGTDAQPRKAAASATMPRPSSRIPKLPAAIGLATLAFLMLAIVFYLRDGRQTVKVEIDAELVKDATVTVWLDGREMEIRGLGETIRLKPGEHGYEIRRGDQVIRTQEFTVVRGENPALRIAVEESPPAAPPPASADAPAVAGKPHELFFDGEYAYVETPVKYDGSHPLTLEAWVMPGLSENAMPDVFSSSGTTGLNMTYNMEQKTWSTWLPTQTTWRLGGISVNRSEMGQRTHIAYVYDGRTSGCLFVDGLRQPAAFEASPEMLASELPIFIAADPIMNEGRIEIQKFFAGQVDEVRISRVARYHTDFVPQKRFEPDEDTMALYHFDEGQGYVAHDASGHGNHARIFGAEWVEVGQKPPLPGIVARPAPITGLGRWQVATRYANSDMHCVAWSPDGTQIACTTQAGWVRIHDATTLEPVRLLGGDGGAVRAVAWSPDGKWLAATNQGRLWDADGKPGPLWKSLGSARSCIAWSPDGQQLATDYDWGRVQVISLDGSAKPIVAENIGVSCVAWSPDGKHVACAGAAGEVRVWHADGTETSKLPGHTGTVRAVAWRADGQKLASAGDDGEIRTWNADGTQDRVLKGHSEPISSLAWHPGGTKILSGGYTDGTVRIWQADGSGEPVVMMHYLNVYSVAWSPDGTQIASVGLNGILRLWQEDGTPGHVAGHDRHSVHALACNHRTGQIAIAISSSTSVRLWGPDGKLERVLPAQPRDSMVTSLAWSSDGERLAAGAYTGAIRVWNTKDNTAQQFNGHQRRVNNLAWSPDGSRLASASGDATARIWLMDGTAGPVLGAHQGKVVHLVTWSPDGEELATASDDGMLRIWRSDGTLETAVEEHPRSLDWSPNGECLAMGVIDAVKLWRRDGKPVFLWEGPFHPSVSLVAWSPDGSLVSAGNGARIGLWTNEGAPRALWRGPSVYVTAVAWTGDGRHLVSGDISGRVCMWNTETGAAKWTAICLKDHRSVVFSPTGEIVHGHPKVIEEELVYLIEQPDGTTELLKPSEFAKRTGR